MFAQGILILLLLIGFIVLNWKLWIGKIVYKYFGIAEETDADKELEEEIEELKQKRAEVAAMKDIVKAEKELAKLDGQIKKLQEQREAIDF